MGKKEKREDVAKVHHDDDSLELTKECWRLEEVQNMLETIAATGAKSTCLSINETFQWNGYLYFRMKHNGFVDM